MTLFRNLLLLTFLALNASFSCAGETLHERFVAAVERKDGEAVASLFDEAVRDANKVDWISLFTAAQLAVYVERMADAQFFYHAAQVRSGAELTAFPPTDSSGVPALRSRFKQQVGQLVNPLMVPYSKDFIAAVKRLKQWQPDFPSDYRPDWKFDAASSTPVANALAVAKKNHLDTLEDLAFFLGDDNYLQALRISQAYHKATYNEQDNPKRKAENDAAEKHMLDIEIKAGRQGFMSLR